MRALHINRTGPFFLRNTGEYTAEDFEIFTTVLSALKWREKNGTIKMVTDTAGAKFYKDRGMEELWDEGIEIALDDIPVDERMFWAAGKLYALRREKTPIAVIDTDFIVWDSILFDALPPLCAVHDEPLYPDVYPPPEVFKMKDAYAFDPSLDTGVNALNTAFFVVQDQRLLERYTGEAIRFMEGALEGGDSLTYMVFAEQRLLPMCARAEGIEYGTFSTLERLFKNGEGFFTHTWGMKQQMRDDPMLREAFCRRCAGRIIRDFPQYGKMISDIPEIKKYFS